MATEPSSRPAFSPQLILLPLFTEVPGSCILGRSGNSRRASTPPPPPGPAALGPLTSSTPHPASFARRPASSGGRPPPFSDPLGRPLPSSSGRLPSSSGPPVQPPPLAFSPRPSSSLPAGPADLLLRASSSPPA